MAQVTEGVQAETPKNSTTGRRKAFTIFFVVVALLLAGGLFFWFQSRQFETTDDAEVDAHLNSVSARVDGTITAVYADDNQRVAAGAPLVNLDPRDYQVALTQAQAQIDQARSLVVAQQPNIPITQVESATSITSADADVVNAQAAIAAAEKDRDTASARVAEAEANNARAQADVARYRQLIAKEEVSQQEFDQIAATAKAQQAALDASQSSVASAERIVEQRRAQLSQVQARLQQVRRTAPQQIAIRRATVQSDQASVETARAQAEQAQLKIQYTKILAPVSGIVLRRSAEIGAHVAAGQQLMQIAQIGDMWVTANFKETQLRRIQPGQAVRIHIDATDADFDGSIESIGGSTGAVASVLPPENATGNFVKVVQRIPVRIRFKQGQKGLDALRPGMSAEPKVRIEG